MQDLAKLIEISRKMSEPYTLGEAVRPNCEVMFRETAGFFNRVLTDYPFETMLEVGPGLGMDCEFWAKAGKIVTAIDISPGNSLLQSAETHGYTVVTGDMHDLPFADGVFDCVASKHTLEHSLLPMVAIEETKRDANAGHFVQGWNKLHLSYLIAVCGFEVLASDEKGWSASVLGRKVADGYEGVDFNIIAARWRKPEAK